MHHIAALKHLPADLRAPWAGCEEIGGVTPLGYMNLPGSWKVFKIKTIEKHLDFRLDCETLRRAYVRLARKTSVSPCHLKTRSTIPMFARLSILILTVFLVCTVTPGAEPVWSEEFNLNPPLMFNGAVLAIAETPDAVYYGGEFTHVGEIEANYIVKIDKATGAVQPIGGNAQIGTNGPVFALAVIGNALYVGGRFTTVGLPSYMPPVSTRGIARWSLDNWGGWLPIGAGAELGSTPLVEVRALTEMNGALCVGGTFSSVNSTAQGTISANNVAFGTSTLNHGQPSATQHRMEPATPSMHWPQMALICMWEVFLIR